jgi:hypothetical protein
MCEGCQLLTCAYDAHVRVPHGRGLTVGSRARYFIGGIVALAIGVPAGYALADTAGLGGSEEQASETTGIVPAENCPVAAAIWEEAGMPRDTFTSRCPTAEEAQERAREIVSLRKRGLQRIEAAMAKYGGPEDADDLAAIRAELQQLHVPEAEG